MKVDRQITISTAESRYSPSLTRETLLYSDFITRLREPARGKESHIVYMAMDRAI